MSDWPKITTVARAIADRPEDRIAEVIEWKGRRYRGLYSSHPWIFMVTGAGTVFAVCSYCEANDQAPEPPASMAPGAPRTALLAPGTQGHATFVLTWLNGFLAAHKACEPKRPA